MSDESIVMEPPAQEDSRPLDMLTIISWIALSLVMAFLGYWFGARQMPVPGEGSPEVGFARDMIIHHAQAVDMSNLLRDRSDDPELDQLALDIMLTQQAQIGQMQGWLTVWGRPIARTGPAMEWMGMPTTGLMPGMATPEQLNQLRELRGREAEILFLQLMIRHHQSGVAMAQAAVERAQRPEVRGLAQSMVDAQLSEISLMQEMLQQKGAEPVPEDELMEHSHDDH